MNLIISSTLLDKVQITRYCRSTETAGFKYENPVQNWLICRSTADVSVLRRYNVDSLRMNRKPNITRSLGFNVRHRHMERLSNTCQLSRRELQDRRTPTKSRGRFRGGYFVGYGDLGKAGRAIEFAKDGYPGIATWGETWKWFSMSAGEASGR